MENSDRIAPFSWCDNDDGSAQVTLYVSERYKKKLFRTRKREGFVGSGYDWEQLAGVFIQQRVPELQSLIHFDSEHQMFCAYSSDCEALRRFIFAFKESCERDDEIADLFSRTPAPKPISKQDMQFVLDTIMGRSEEE